MARNSKSEIEFNGYPDIGLSGRGYQNIRVSGNQKGSLQNDQLAMVN